MEIQKKHIPSKRGISKENWEKILVQSSSVVKGIPVLYQNSSFENFNVDDQNRNVFLKCAEYASNPKGFLTITGTTGSGKTHLAVAIAKSLPPIELSEDQMKNKEKEIKLSIQHLSKIEDESHQQQYKKLLIYYSSKVWYYKSPAVIFIRIIRFLIELHETSKTIQGSTITKLDFLNNVLRHDLIVLDDFGSEKLSEAARQNLFFIIDECYVNNKNLIVTSNNTIDEINAKEPRIASRLSSGQVLYLNADDYRITNLFK